MHFSYASRQQHYYTSQIHTHTHTHTRSYIFHTNTLTHALFKCSSAAAAPATTVQHFNPVWQPDSDRTRLTHACTFPNSWHESGMYDYMHTCIHVYIHKSTCRQFPAWEALCIVIYIHTCMRTYIKPLLPIPGTRPATYIHLNSYLQTYTACPEAPFTFIEQPAHNTIICIHTYIHTYIHTCIQSVPRSSWHL
jgi:hypothetical protein